MQVYVVFGGWDYEGADSAGPALFDCKSTADAAAADEQAWFAKWEATRPQGTYGTWNISDRD